MIIVEIYVPSLDKSYDFKLNEDVVVSVIIEEVNSVICQKEQCSVEGKGNNFLLLKTDTNQVLSMNLSLFENDIKAGDVLILV